MIVSGRNTPVCFLSRHAGLIKDIGIFRHFPRASNALRPAQCPRDAVQAKFLWFAPPKFGKVAKLGPQWPGPLGRARHGLGIVLAASVAVPRCLRASYSGKNARECPDRSPESRPGAATAPGAHPYIRSLPALPLTHAPQISPRNHSLFTPLLASTSTGTLEFRSIVEFVRLARGRVPPVASGGHRHGNASRALRLRGGRHRV